MFEVTLRYISGSLRLPWWCSVMFMFILCEVMLKLLKVCLTFPESSSTQTKPLMTNIHEMCNKVWLLQHLRVGNHVISPQIVCKQKTKQKSNNLIADIKS